MPARSVMHGHPGMATGPRRNRPPVSTSRLAAVIAVIAGVRAGICITACEDCEIECRRHDHHIECKACAEACAKVVELARKLVA